MLPNRRGFGKILQQGQWVADVRYEVEVTDSRNEPTYCATLALRRGSLITRFDDDDLVLVCPDGNRFHLQTNYEVGSMGCYRVGLLPIKLPTQPH